MTVHVSLPDELAKAIDYVASARAAFVAEAVRRHLRQSKEAVPDEVDRINEVVDELNREAEDALEYQVIP